MITDKDREAISGPEELLSKMFRDIREIGYFREPLRLTEESHDACIKLIKQYADTIRAESAEQARKEAADRVTCAWREHGEDITLRILRDAILSTVKDSLTVAPVSPDAEKLDIAELDKGASKEAEPDDDAIDEAWGVARQVYDGIAADLARLSDAYVFNPFASACLIQQYAEDYHSSKVKQAGQ